LLLLLFICKTAILNIAVLAVGVSECAFAALAVVSAPLDKRACVNLRTRARTVILGAPGLRAAEII
jgi:hypothetical protein